MNASSFFTSRFTNIFGKILELPTDKLDLQYIESSGEFLVKARSLSSSKTNEILDKLKNSSFVSLIQKEMNKDNELKELKVEKASLPSIKPALSKLIHSS